MAIVHSCICLISNLHMMKNEHDEWMINQAMRYKNMGKEYISPSSLCQ